VHDNGLIAFTGFANRKTEKPISKPVVYSLFSTLKAENIISDLHPNHIYQQKEK
jgi:hypothetical protein